MTSKEHSHNVKYTINPNELGIWGIGCTALSALVDKLQNKYPHIRFGYYDVKHDEMDSTPNTILNSNKISLKLSGTVNQYQMSNFFNSASLVLVNGNHQMASTMWLILDGKKEYKHQDQLLEKTRIIFYNNTTASLAHSLQLKYPNIQLQEGTEVDTLIHLIHQKATQVAPLHGLILVGGKSSRMKENKSMIVYHQKQQYLHLYDLLEPRCEQTFISCTLQDAALYPDKPLIYDQITGLGPLSGILSALMHARDHAFIVLACDLPLINEQTINQLIKERNPSKMATTFMNDDSGFLEPLITIYEPKALPVMLSMLAQGFTCPRKMLMHNDIEVIKPEHTHALKNINFPEEKEIVMQHLKHH